MPAIKLKKVTAEYIAQKEKEVKELGKKDKPEKKNLEDVANEEGKEEEEEEVKPFNFLEVEILHDKRKRTLPVVDQNAMQWLDDNLEKKDDVFIPLMMLYEYYAETCQLQGVGVVDIPVFMKFMREKFGKTYGFKDSSLYKGLVKERKVKVKKPHVQGETLALKIKDIINEVITAAGNPKKGLRFGALKVGINSKYPALRVDMYPKKLQSALERGIRFGHIELVKGAGLCGFYRLPGESTLEEDKEEPKQKKKEKKEGEEDEEKKEGEESKESGTESSETDDSKPGEEKGTKRKLEEGEEGEPEKKKQKKKKKPRKKLEKWGRGEAAKHSDPQRVEDAFPLAITYQSDPKEASVAKIKMYITKHYGDVNPERLKKALESGIEKGLWENTRGSGAGGTYHLLIDTFNPSRSDTMDDRIAQAIVATHEPKQASAHLIRKYISQYHPGLKTEEKPHLFKHALERAGNKGAIRQVTGIGATGTWLLVDHFYPSPAILAGESEDEEDEWESDNDEYGEKYVPRPTKRDRTRSKEAVRPKVDRSAPQPKKKKAAKEEPKSKTKTKTPKKSPKKTPKKSPKTKAIVVDSSEDEVEEEEAYKPQPSKRRGGTPAKAPAKAEKGKTTAKKSPKSKEIVVESSDEEGEIEAPEPQPTKKRGKTGAAEKESKSKPVESSDEEGDAYVPRPTKRGRGTPAKDSPPAKKKESESSKPAKAEKSPAKSAKKKRR